MERRSDYEAKLALSGPGTPLDIQQLRQDLMAEAERRRDIVLALEQGDRFDDETVSAAAKAFGCSKRQFNRYRQRYRETDQLTSLLSQGRNGGRGKSRLPEDLEEIIQQVLEEYDRNLPEALDIQIIGEIERRCDEAGVKCCSRKTLRARIQKVSGRERTARRYGRKIARELHEPHKGQTPKLDFPLERIQIDHTLVDVVCTGTHDRGHVGRLWITLAIDEATRAILAFVLSWDYPNASTVAQCLYRVMVPKDEWLTRVGTQRTWPMFGKPDRIYVDNASEFSSQALRFGCKQYNIGLEHRPMGLPHFGGIIERVVGTVMTEMRLLSAATAKRRGFSKVKTVSPNEKAEMSREELEAWLIEFICGQYHNRPHSSTRQNPQLAWMRGIYGTERRAGRGAPAVPKDKQKIYLDFADIKTRTIERYGVRWDNITYWGEVLRPFLDAGDQRRHIVRRNPYDASRIYFRHPDDPDVPVSVVPVLYVSMAGVTSGRGLLMLILHRLGAPYSAGSSAESLYPTVVSLLARVGTKVLIIDEIHNVAFGNRLDRLKVLSVIKGLGNDLKFTIVGFGTPDALRALKWDPQIERRFEPIRIPRWGRNAETYGFLNSLETTLPLQKPSFLSEDPVADWLIAQSEGLTREIVHLVRRGAIQAIRKGRECIDLPLLKSLKYTPASVRRAEIERVLEAEGTDRFAL